MKDEERNILLYGKEVVEKEKLFVNALKEIEQTHIQYFRNRRIERDPGHDLLHYHWYTHIGNGIVTFNFKHESDLSENIREECLEAFTRIHKV